MSGAVPQYFSVTPGSALAARAAALMATTAAGTVAITSADGSSVTAYLPLGGLGAVPVSGRGGRLERHDGDRNLRDVVRGAGTMTPVDLPAARARHRR